jgi:hypothetical protein
VRSWYCTRQTQSMGRNAFASHRRTTHRQHITCTSLSHVHSVLYLHVCIRAIVGSLDSKFVRRIQHRRPPPLECRGRADISQCFPRRHPPFRLSYLPEPSRPAKEIDDLTKLDSVLFGARASCLLLTAEPFSHTIRLCDSQA